MSSARCSVVVVLVLALLVPAAALGAGAEQLVITLVDEPAPWEFADPCTGEAVHGIGIENGVVRVTELGDQGHHVRVNVNGIADLYDTDENFVGTWTYRLSFGDQFPPDAQGAVHMVASGPLRYADGHTAIVHLYHHNVFAKGDIEKWERNTATCSRGPN